MPKTILILQLSLLFLVSAAMAESNLGYLSVTSDPPRALVYLDGKYVDSVTPTVQLLGLEPTVYRVELAKQGYKLYQEKITIEPGKLLELNVTLARVDSGESSKTFTQRYVEAYLTISSSPTGAEVYLDDNVIGKTPIRTRELETEEQIDRRIKLTKTGYESYEDTISWESIRDRVKINISVKLEPVKKADGKSAPSETPTKPKKPKKLVINDQVILFSVLLLVLIAALVVRIITRRRQSSSD